MNKKVLAVLVVLVLLLGAAYVKRRGIMRVLSGGGYQTATIQPTQPAMETSPAAAANSLYMMKTDPKLGSYFTDPNGMTLYTYNKDTANVSNCTGKCITNWPPYVASNPVPTLPADWGTMKRSDGTLQYTFKNMPLYYYSGDKAPGDINGQGIGNSWFAAK